MSCGEPELVQSRPHDLVVQLRSTWLRKSHKKQSVMLARHVLPSIGEVEVLRDEEAEVRLRCFPHDIVVLTSELFVSHGVDVVSEFSEVRDEPMAAGSRPA